MRTMKVVNITVSTIKHLLDYDTYMKVKHCLQMLRDKSLYRVYSLGVLWISVNGTESIGYPKQKSIHNRNRIPYKVFE